MPSPMTTPSGQSVAPCVQNGSPIEEEERGVAETVRSGGAADGLDVLDLTRRHARVHNERLFGAVPHIAARSPLVFLRWYR